MWLVVLTLVAVTLPPPSVASGWGRGSLPGDTMPCSGLQRHCLTFGRLLQPETGKCVRVGTRGPCGRGEELVATGAVARCSTAHLCDLPGRVRLAPRAPCVDAPPSNDTFGWLSCPSTQQQGQSWLLRRDARGMGQCCEASQCMSAASAPPPLQPPAPPPPTPGAAIQRRQSLRCRLPDLTTRSQAIVDEEYPWPAHPLEDVQFSCSPAESACFSRGGLPSDDGGCHLPLSACVSSSFGVQAPAAPTVPVAPAAPVAPAVPVAPAAPAAPAPTGGYNYAPPPQSFQPPTYLPPSYSAPSPYYGYRRRREYTTLTASGPASAPAAAAAAGVWPGRGKRRRRAAPPPELLGRWRRGRRQTGSVRASFTVAERGNSTVRDRRWIPDEDWEDENEIWDDTVPPASPWPVLPPPPGADGWVTARVASLPDGRLSLRAQCELPRCPPGRVWTAGGVLVPVLGSQAANGGCVSLWSLQWDICSGDDVTFDLFGQAHCTRDLAPWTLTRCPQPDPAAPGVCVVGGGLGGGGGVGGGPIGGGPGGGPGTGSAGGGGGGAAQNRANPACATNNSGDCAANALTEAPRPN